MSIRDRFSKLADGVKNAIPARREPAGAYPPEDTWAPEDELYPPEDGFYLPEDELYPPEDGYYPPEEGYYPPEDELYPPEDGLPPEDAIPAMEEEDWTEPAGGDIPIEEFTLDEMAEEEPPGELYPETEEPVEDPYIPQGLPAPVWQPAEPEEPLQDDPRRRPRLLSKKGRLRHPGWAETDRYEYNKERIRHPFRRKEWELYQCHNDRFALRICYGHAAYMSLVEVSFTDFATGERYSSGKRRFFPGDSLDLDFTGGEPHSLKYEDGELFLSISFDGDVRRILVRSTELEADISCHDAGDAMVTAVPFAFSGQFAYNYKKVFRDLFGHVSLHNLDQTLDTDTFLSLWSGRGVWPYRYSILWGAGAQETEDGVLALNLGAGYGREDAPSENAVFVDGKLIKLGEVYFRFSSENHTKPWRMADRDRRVKLTFRPACEDVSRVNWLLLDTRVNRLYGRLSGRIELPDGAVREIKNMPFFCQYGVYRW